MGPEGLVSPALNDLPDRPVTRPPGPRPDAEPQGPVRISEEVRPLLLRLAPARRNRDLAGTRGRIKECDGMLNRRGTPPPALREARESAARWLVERSKEVIKQGRNGKTMVLTGVAAKRELEEEKIAAERRALVHELQLALRHEHFGDVRVLLRFISQLTGGGRPARKKSSFCTEPGSGWPAATSSACSKRRSPAGTGSSETAPRARPLRARSASTRPRTAANACDDTGATTSGLSWSSRPG